MSEDSSVAVSVLLRRAGGRTLKSESDALHSGTGLGGARRKRVSSDAQKCIERMERMRGDDVQIVLFRTRLCEFISRRKRDVQALPCNLDQT